MTQFDDIIVTPVYGPLSTNNYPNIIPKMNLGVLTGLRPNPPKFYPANGSSEFSNSRAEYFRAATRSNNQYGIIAKSGGSCGNTKSLYNTQPGYIPQYGKSNKYIAPQSSSQFISTRKRNAIGQSSYKQGLPIDSPLSYKNYNKNDVKTSLRYVRAGGCTAPAKKGSIYNKSTPGNGIYVSSSFSM